MNFFSGLKKPVAALMMTVLLSGGTSAYGYDIPQWLTDKGLQTYSAAKADFARGSFSGYCGTYVRCQLKAMGIFNGKYDFRGNGNQWYAGFDNVSSTSGGYWVYRESGGDCINKLVAKYGNDLKNIVISFPVQAHYSPQNPGAGHVFMLYALIDGIAYYSESFSFGSNPEGCVIAEDVNALMARYNAHFGAANGCVLFSAQDLSGPTQEEILAQAQAQQQTQEVLESIEESSEFLFFAEKFMKFADGAVISA